MPELTEPVDDGLPTMEVGEWSRDKHHFLARYICAFTTAMRNKRWSGLHYIDLFAGPGLLRLKGSDKLIWGSPLIAAHCAGFDGIYLCEKNAEYCQALRTRLDSTSARAKIHVYEGDANGLVSEIIQSIPRGTLSLAFLDPFGLHLHFETLRVLAKRRVDLIVFFPDHLDALRNCEYVYKDQPRSNLDKVLGTETNWRSALDATARDRWGELLRNLYVKQIRKLGYSEFEFERISNRAGPLYMLIFCSHDSVGAKIWNGISNKKPDGQRTFDL